MSTYYGDPRNLVGGGPTFIWTGSQIGISGTSVQPYAYTIPSPTLVPTTTPSLHLTGLHQLTDAQLKTLIAGHHFIPMDGDYCLFCYALDMYRTAIDHYFVIHEE